MLPLATTPTASKSPLMTTAWSPTPGCCFRPSLAQHLGLPQLVDRHLDLGRAPGRANAGDKMMTLVASALAGGDCIDDADALRAGTDLLGCWAAWSRRRPPPAFAGAGSGDLPAQLPVGPRPPVGPSEPRAAGTGLGNWWPDPGDAPFTIDLDSTICETYGLAKEGARHHGYTG